MRRFSGLSPTGQFETLVLCLREEQRFAPAYLRDPLAAKSAGRLAFRRRRSKGEEANLIAIAFEGSFPVPKS
jgi:hypothetical protein